MDHEHIPVMLDEIIKYLSPNLGQYFIDCTLGGGGYTFKIAEIVGEKGLVLGIDMDKKAIQNVEEKIKITKCPEGKKNKNIILAHDNFKNLQSIIQEKLPEKFISKEGEDAIFDGIVFDLGLSSDQLNDQSRGFSFQHNAPLNMAFGDLENKKTERIINKFSLKALTKIFRDYGEEKYAYFIARAIEKTRKEKEIKTTDELVEIIRKNTPPAYRNKKIHFATKVFQALRIATNNELKNIEEALPFSLDLLKPGAKIVVVSFHSLEDRIVKHFFKKESIDCICPPEAPICQCNHQKQIKIITKKPLRPSAEEVKNNPRARSALLRVAEKI
jgi:16S rRNA (cytosine1402-N4)-methyltransferase